MAAITCHLRVVCVSSRLSSSITKGDEGNRQQCIATALLSHSGSFLFFFFIGHFAKLHVHYTRIWLIGLHEARCTGNVSFQRDRCESNRSQQPTAYFTQAVKDGRNDALLLFHFAPRKTKVSPIGVIAQLPPIWGEGSTGHQRAKGISRREKTREMSCCTLHQSTTVPVWLLRAFYRAKCTAGMSPQCNRRYFTGTSLFTCGQIALALEIE